MEISHEISDSASMHMLSMNDNMPKTKCEVDLCSTQDVSVAGLPLASNLGRYKHCRSPDSKLGTADIVLSTPYAYRTSSRA